MSSSLINMLITNLLSVLALIVTVIGWFYTARQQKRLLELQIASESRKESRQLYVPSRLRDLEKLKDWFKEGAEIGFRKCLGGTDVTTQQNLDIRFTEWQSRFLHVSPIAVQISTGSLPIKGLERGDASIFHDATSFLQSLTNLIGNPSTDTVGDPHWRQVLTSYAGGLSEIERLTEIIAKEQ